MPDRRISMASALTGVTDASRIATALDSTRVVVVVPEHASPTVAAAAAGLVSMASRLLGEIVVRGGGQLPTNPWGAATLGDALQLHQVVGRAILAPLTEIVVAFGNASSRAQWHVGGDDWTAVLSRCPTAIGPCNLGGLGLHAAAGFAFGEILKTVLRPLGMRCVPLEHTLIWNLLDGRLAPAPRVGAREPRHAAAIAVLGAGSLGSSGVGVLSMTPARGIAYVVDPDRFDPARNTYRYPATPPGTAGPKAEWAANVLQSAGWEAAHHDGTINDWVRSRPAAGFDGMALVSVDRVDGRLDAADLLARTTISAGVSGLALHAQRSGTADDFACPYCAYVDVAPPMTQLEVYAGLTGLPTRRVADLLAGDTLTPADLEAAASRHKLTEEGAAGLVGGRLEDLLHRRYAQAQVAVGNSGLVAGVSAPHVSWLGGILMAAEVVKVAADIVPLERRVELDLSGVPLGGWRSPRRDQSGRCTCANPVRRDLARRLYAA
jgi:hypothetical protein